MGRVLNWTLGLATGAALWGAVAAETCGTPEQCAKRDAEASARMAAYSFQYRADKALREAMRDPASAEVRNASVISKGGGLAYCGEVNGKNGFGGFVGFKRFVVHVDGIQLEGQSPDFAQSWAMRCRS